MITFHCDVQGLQQFLTNLQRVDGFLATPSTLLEHVVQKAIRPAIKRTFDSQDEGRWDPISTRQARMDRVGGPLVLTGETMESLTDESSSGFATAGYKKKERDAITIGTKRVDAPGHFLGDDRTGEPARPFIVIGQRELYEMEHEADVLLLHEVGRIFR